MSIKSSVPLVLLTPVICASAQEPLSEGYAAGAMEDARPPPLTTRNVDPPRVELAQVTSGWTEKTFPETPGGPESGPASEASRRQAAVRKLQEGQSHYADGNYEAALPLFEAAHRIQPSLVTARHLALTYFNLQQYEQARPLLEDVVARQPDDAEARFALAETLLASAEDSPTRDQDLRKALRHAQYLANAAPGPRAQLLLGRAYAALGRTQAAIAALENALDESDPFLYQAVSLELIPLYAKERRFGKAKTLTERAVALDPQGFDVPALRRLGTQLELAPRPYSISLGYRFEYDSNVPVVPSDSSLTPLISDESDFRHTVFADLLAQRNLGRGFEVFGEAHVNHGFHQDLDEFDFTEQNYVASLGWGRPRYGVRLPLEYSQTNLDGDTVLQTISASAGVYFRPTDQMLLYGFGRFEDNDFDDTAAELSPSEDRDGDTGVIGAHLRWQFLENRGEFRSTVEYGHEDTDGRNWERDTLRLYVYGEYRIVPRLALGLGYEYLDFEHDNVHDVFLVQREDTIHSVFGLASYALDKRWLLQLQAAYLESESNIDLFEYDRYIVSMGATWRY